MSATTSARALTARLGANAIPDGLALPMADNVIVLAGWQVAVNSSGYVVPATSSAAIRVIGRANADADNTGVGHAAGAVACSVGFGAFNWNNSAAGDEITISDRFQLCYAVDNQTVALTSGTGTRAPAGVILDVVANGTDPQVLVLQGPEVVAFADYLAAMAALTALTDNSGGTATNTIAALNGGTLTGVDGTGSNAAPLAGVNTALGVIRNAIASLAAKVDAIIAAA